MNPRIVITVPNGVYLSEPEREWMQSQMTHWMKAGGVLVLTSGMSLQELPASPPLWWQAIPDGACIASASWAADVGDGRTQ